MSSEPPVVMMRVPETVLAPCSSPSVGLEKLSWVLIVRCLIKSDDPSLSFHVGVRHSWPTHHMREVTLSPIINYAQEKNSKPK